MTYINSKEKINNIKFNKDNFYVVADFDKTITKGNSTSTWGMVATANGLGEEYTKRRTALYEHYRPIEIDPIMSDEEKSQYMSEWWGKHINLFYEFGLTEDTIDKSLKNGGLCFRDGAKNFLEKMNNLHIPVIIISAGIGNVIEKFLKNENSYFDNIKIISNFINFQNGKIQGFEGEIIHALNKNIISLDENSKHKLQARKYTLLLGDGLADLKMVPKENIENTITVGFLDEKIEENLQYFNNCFDIVLTNEGSFDEVSDILKINNMEGLWI